MKNKFLTFMALALVLVSACGCTRQTTTQEPPKVEKAVVENPVITADADFAKKLQGILNKGYEISDTTKVYYTRSKDFKEVYFVGTIVKNNGQYYNGIWATDNVDFLGLGVIYSMSDDTVKISGMGDGRKNTSPITEYHDGYLRILSLLNKELQNAVYNK